MLLLGTLPEHDGALLAIPPAAVIMDVLERNLE